ncbi:MAG: hypothetical protein J7K15_10315 [Deltaproteobacteria bacterium]|nr:hypothetical protein [Deltaproteobacteria bacterium]
MPEKPYTYIVVRKETKRLIDEMVRLIEAANFLEYGEVKSVKKSDVVDEAVRYYYEHVVLPRLKKLGLDKKVVGGEEENE